MFTTETVALVDVPSTSRRGLRANGSAAARSASLLDLAGAPTPVALTDRAPVSFKANVLPLVHLNDAVNALQLADCLAQADVQSILVSVSNFATCEAIKRIRQRLPQLQIGADLAQPGFADSAKAAGADFLISSVVSPGIDLSRVRSVRELRHRLALQQFQWVMVPGHLQLGLTLLKILAVEAPAQRIAVVGAVERHDLPFYLAQCNVAAVAAPWTITPELTRQRDWPRIAQYLRVAAAMAATYS